MAIPFTSYFRSFSRLLYDCRKLAISHLVIIRKILIARIFSCYICVRGTTKHRVSIKSSIKLRETVLESLYYGFPFLDIPNDPIL